MNLLIRNINISDINKLKKFHCGKNAMDLFLSKEAYINHIFGEGTTQLVVDEDENEVIAYFTLKCDMMVIDDKEMYSEPRYIPCIEISRLAVQLKEDGYNIISGPRMTGNDYYEFLVLAFEGNQIEVCI